MMSNARRIGRYERRVTVQSRTLTSDGYGGQAASWATLYTLWAYIRPLAGREGAVGDREQAELTTEVGLRGYWSDVRPTMRIAYGGRTLEIISVQPDEELRDTVCICREVVA